MAKTIKVDSVNVERVSQGDLIEDVEFIEYAIEKNGVVSTSY